VQLIISDACRGLMESAAEYLPEARWQRCMVPKKPKPTTPSISVDATVTFEADYKALT
jgi:hypothetical protein